MNRREMVLLVVRLLSKLNLCLVNIKKKKINSSMNQLKHMCTPKETGGYLRKKKDRKLR